MSDRTINGLRGCLSSIDMALSPAASADPLAREQAGLLARYLRFLEQRVHRIHERVRYELAWYLHMADGVREAAGQDADGATELAQAHAVGTACLAAAGAGTPELQASALALQAAVARLVRQSRGADPARRRGIEAVVLQASVPIVRMQRAWFAPQAWEAGEPLDLEAALRELPSAKGV